MDTDSNVGADSRREVFLNTFPSGATSATCSRQNSLPSPICNERSRAFVLMVNQHVPEHPAFGVADEGEETNRRAAEAAKRPRRPFETGTSADRHRHWGSRSSTQLELSTTCRAQTFPRRRLVAQSNPQKTPLISAASAARRLELRSRAVRTYREQGLNPTRTRRSVQRRE